MWDIKYRPKKFSAVLGQEAIVRILKSRISEQSLDSTSFIFSGGMGLGKTTLARILAKAILCQSMGEDQEPCCVCDDCLAVDAGTSPAFTERDAACSGTVEHMRALVEELPFAVMGGGKRISLFDEAHRMSRDAQDILLKPIEEKKLVAIFCTTEPEKLRGAIRSRCEHYQIQKVPVDVLMSHLKDVLAAEGVRYEDEALRVVVEFSGGHVRDVLNRLEMISYLGDVSVESVRTHLRLSGIETMHEILLNINNPQELIPRVDDLLREFSPYELSERLADVAVTAFRAGSGLDYSQHSYAPELSESLFGKHGSHLLGIAGGLLKEKRTQAALLAELLTWGTAPTVAAPTVVVPSSSSQPAGVRVQPPSIAHALTVLDHEAIPKSMPRGAVRASKPGRSLKVATDAAILTPTEWTVNLLQHLGAN